MPASQLYQVSQYRGAFVSRSGADHTLTRGGLISEPRAAAVEIGQPCKRFQAVLFKLDVTRHLDARLIFVAKLFVKLGQFQLDLGILRIKLADFGQPGAGFAGRIWDDRLRAEKL